MKKTLLLTHEYFPFKGGVSRYCYNLFKFFDTKDYLIITDHPQVKTKDNIINIKLCYPFIKPSWIFSLIKIKFLIRKHKIEQIFTPNIFPLGTIAYFLKIPYFISLHGLDINLAMKNNPALAKKILDNAKAIIVNTKNTANIIKDLNFDKKIKIIYPALDFNTDYDETKFRAFKNKLDIREHEKVLLTVGRLVHRKGQDLVVQAMAQLKNEFDLKYLIVGEGPVKQELKDLIKQHNLQDRVAIFDRIEDEELLYYYLLSDIFVMPHRHLGSDIEGLGMVFLEAAKIKVPIIAGDSGGITEIFTNQQDALLVKSEDLRGLVKAIKYLLNNPANADKMAEQAFKRSQDFKGAEQQSLALKEIIK